MARRRSAEWSKSLHLREGALGPIKGRTASQIVQEGLKRAKEQGDANPREAVQKRIQVLVNLNHPETAKLRKALQELAKSNPAPARRSTENRMARSAPKAPGSRLAGAIMKATAGKIPKGATFKQRGSVIKKANAKLQPKISGNTLPSQAEINKVVRDVIASTTFSKPGSSAPRRKAAKKKAAPKRAKKAAKKKAAPKRAKKAAKKKAAPKRAKKAAKKSAQKKPRTAAQKAATRKMIAANRASRKAAPKKKAAKKKASKKAKPTKKTGQRAAAVRGHARGKRGRGGVVPGNRTRTSSPTGKQRDVAATFGLVGKRAFQQGIANLTGEGVTAGKATRVYYMSPKNPDQLYKHTLKKSQRPTVYMDANAANAVSRAAGQPENNKKANRKQQPMGGRWVEIGECHGVDVLVGNKKTTVVFGGRGALPVLLVDEKNERLALTWKGGSMKRAPARERIMFLQHARGPVVSTRGIIS